MTEAARPTPSWDESARIAALERYAILDTPRETEFDDIARLAADILDAPIAVVNLIAADRQWFKAEVGIGTDTLPLDVSLCAHAIRQNGILVVPDTTRDPRFDCNPLVTGAPGLRFYAGALIETPEGLPIGTVCVLDTIARPDGITDRQRLTLEVLSRQVMTQIELRRTLATQAERGDRLIESEERLRLAVDNAEIGFWDVDIVHDALIWPPRTKAMFGISPDVPVTMQDFYSGLHPEDLAATSNAFAAAIDPAQRALYDVDYRTVGKEDGVVRWVAAKGRGLFDAREKCVRVIGTAIDITPRKAIEAALKQLNETLEEQVVLRTAERNRLWSMNNLLMAVVAFDSTVREVNPGWPALLGWVDGDLIGRSYVDFVHPDDRQRSLDWTLRLAAGEEMGELENRYRTNDDSYRTIAWSIERGDGVLHCVGRDVTAERAQAAALAAIEDALRQSQKMEAVGQLTGGIAHDFNNMLAVVIGSLDLLGRRIGTADARTRRYVDAAMDGAKRAATLTQRLLAFSRQQPLKPEPIDANKLVAGMSELLGHSLGGDVRLETVLAGGLWRIHADPNQLENVILNLAINARDAMPGGGRLTIETQNAYLDDRYVAQHLGISAGQYVLIAVTDTGTGMPPAVIAKAFDPFFTTKQVGKGTGLGLSQVYGFVRQSGGHVKIYSESGQGTTIKVYLPRLSGAEAAFVAIATDAALARGERQELILVVEDEPAVRRFSLDALSELGYDVIEADGAEAALRLLDARPDIALLFTDVVMPETNGAKLAEAARLKRPDLRILFTTGYTRNAVVHNGVLDAGVDLIGKPFTVEALAAKVRAVLDAA